MKTSDVIAPLPKIPIDPAAYDVSSLVSDVVATIGQPEQTLSPLDPRGTATGQTIAEQSRISVGTSNIDDLDDFLSWMARMGGEILLQEFSEETVKRIVGPGAVWPKTPQDREDFLNAIYLTTKAASSGRPNKTLEINNWRLLAPILQQAGANPQFMVRETIRRVDDQIDPSQAFPLTPMSSPPPGQMGNPPERDQPGQTPPSQRRPGPGKQRLPQPTQP
jgi:hypothetical protein